MQIRAYFLALILSLTIIATNCSSNPLDPGPTQTVKNYRRNLENGELETAVKFWSVRRLNGRSLFEAQQLLSDQPARIKTYIGSKAIIEVEREKVVGDVAEVSVSLNGDIRRELTHYRLVKEGGQWKIDIVNGLIREQEWAALEFTACKTPEQIPLGDQANSEIAILDRQLIGIVCNRFRKMFKDCEGKTYAKPIKGSDEENGLFEISRPVLVIEKSGAQDLDDKNKIKWRGVWYIDAIDHRIFGSRDEDFKKGLPRLIDRSPSSILHKNGEWKIDQQAFEESLRTFECNEVSRYIKP
ncbi:MAG: hypothetical protein SF097_08025 [Acidobacteriota bacterium]|nr:hypothetical protein [Acidobacteriota bacterium]